MLVSMNFNSGLLGGTPYTLGAPNLYGARRGPVKFLGNP